MRLESSPLLSSSNKGHALKGFWREATGSQEIPHLRLLSQLQDCSSATLQAHSQPLVLDSCLDIQGSRCKARRKLYMQAGDTVQHTLGCRKDRHCL